MVDTFSTVVDYGKKQCILTSLKAVVIKITDICTLILPFLPFLIINTIFPLYKLVCFCSQMLPATVSYTHLTLPTKA